MTAPMKILFVHDNFPAQFGLIGEYLAERGWDVLFGTARKDARHPTIKTFTYAPHRAITKGVHPYAGVYEKAVINGQAVARACFDLKRKGYRPDVMVAHSGWGPGIFLKDVWPEARYVGYFEWWYQPNGPDVAFLSEEPQSEDDLCRTRARNAPILADLAACDVGITPTKWQQAQFPAVFHDRLTVLHDGVLTDVYAPAPGTRLRLDGLDLGHAEEIITYVARGMEPYRGFPEFMAAMEIVQQRRPNAHVVVVGEDRVAYGRKLPDGDSYRKRALEGGRFDMARLHFTGLLPRPSYLKVLQASSVHVYLTVPFVLSWSMMEAMSAGCLIVGSDTEPVRELIRDGENGRLAPFRDPEKIADAVCDVLARPAAHAPMRVRARETILKSYAARDIYPRKETLLRG
jgi:glycosyltransferase involved in cell wall biosynthesis